MWPPDSSAVQLNYNDEKRNRAAPRAARSERQPHADARLPRRLKLRRIARKHARRRQTGIRIRASAERQLGEVVVIEDRLLVEQVEDVSHQRDLARPSELEVVGRLEVQLTLERRPGLEAVDGLDARSSRGDRDFATVRVVRIRRQRRQRFARRRVETEAQVQSKREGVVAEQFAL